MSLATLGLIVLAICVGSLPPLQAGINATVTQYHGHPLWGALTNTLVASLTLLAAILVLRVAPADLAGLSRAPAWSWIGGLLGATMVLSAIVIAPRVGAAAYVSAMLVGTVSASIVIDHFGWVGFPERPLTGGRLFGGALVVAGMLLVQRG